MNYLITETQFKSILLEVKDSKFTSSMKNLNSFTRNIINRTSRVYGINLKFLLKWGAAVGGLVVPLDNFIKGEGFELNDDQIALILVGVACTFFFENKKVLQDVLKKIKEVGLFNIFRKVLTKGSELKNTFFVFLESLNLTFVNMIEMVSYSFLIPIVNDLLEVANTNDNILEASETIAERLLASGVVILTGNILSEVIRKILRRFS